MTVVNLSFAACGFMGIYQLGAVGAFLRHGNMLLASMRACAGASAGALVASVVITAPDKLEHCKEFTYRFASNIRRQTFGPLTPGYDFMMELRDGIEDILPSNAHLLANERLHISITNSRTGKNSMVSSFTSRDDLIKVLLASSFVPIYAGLKPVEFQGQKWIDGGFTDSIPILPVGRTITVSPFSGSQDVCPRHTGRRKLHLRVANMSIIFSKDNIKRLNQALFPPSLPRMQAIHQEGYEDALRFLRTEGWMQ
ncbi:patatin-like phospholipase domain-containing protein 4 isoform X1 [Pygocentrus nattereri]|uniref:PNPLA domain-containing protein n=1 Tax=Pygocentrus nattereri TaxID=42514 RepID=A0A3B4CYD7_PYGNA|nr:patatin-like phospholipase domain-containing protein 4 isoform X1 [Pygocentrus nattereri]XP_037399728.1 patatin-like phospholipase domain-containing protein 4 isoform X1 [Pygocentrus nattereri]